VARSRHGRASQPKPFDEATRCSPRLRTFLPNRIERCAVCCRPFFRIGKCSGNCVGWVHFKQRFSPPLVRFSQGRLLILVLPHTSYIVNWDRVVKAQWYRVNRVRRWLSRLRGDILVRYGRSCAAQRYLFYREDTALRQLLRLKLGGHFRSAGFFCPLV